MLLDDELSELRQGGVVWETEVDRAISGEKDVAQYVKMLERRYDQQAPSERREVAMPSPEAMVAELEDFLKAQRSQEE